MPTATSGRSNSFKGASTYTYGLQRPRDTLLTKATTNGECFY